MTKNTLTETCACGASITATFEWSSDVRTVQIRFHTQHAGHGRPPRIGPRHTGTKRVAK